MKIFKPILFLCVSLLPLSCVEKEIGDVVVYPPVEKPDKPVPSRSVKITLNGLSGSKKERTVSYFINDGRAINTEYDETGAFVIEKAPVKKFLVRVITPAVMEGTFYEDQASDAVNSNQVYNEVSELQKSGKTMVLREQYEVSCECVNYGTFFSLTFEGEGGSFRSVSLTSDGNIASGSKIIMITFPKEYQSGKEILLRVLPSDQEQHISVQGYDDEGGWIYDDRINVTFKKNVTSRAVVDRSRKTAKTYKLYNLYNDGVYTGLICHLNEEKTHGKMLSLDEKKISWCSAQCAKTSNWIGIKSPKVPETKGPYIPDSSNDVAWNGKANTRKIADFAAEHKIAFDETTFSAAAWCVSHNRPGDNVWYLPSTGELVDYIACHYDEINPVLLGLQASMMNVSKLFEILWTSNEREKRFSTETPSEFANAIRFYPGGGYVRGDQVPLPKNQKRSVRAMGDF